AGLRDGDASQRRRRRRAAALLRRHRLTRQNRSADSNRRPGGVTMRPRHSARSQIWIGAGLYGYLVLTLLLPLAIIALWAFYDPAVGWFPPDIVPRSLSVSAWREVLSDREILPSLMLSVVVSVAVTLLTCVLAFPTAWALARFPFRLKRAV